MERKSRLRGRIKKGIVYMVAFGIIGILTSCSQSEEETLAGEGVNEQNADEYGIYGDQIDSDGNTVYTTEDDESEMLDETSNSPQGEYKFDENVVAIDGLMFLVRPDGTVIAKGANTDGCLGDGSRIDKDDWVEVIGLSNIKQIVCIPSGDADDTRHYVYAVEEDGSLWEWGDNIVTPQYNSEYGTIRTIYGDYSWRDDNEYHCLSRFLTTDNQVIGSYETETNCIDYFKEYEGHLNLHEIGIYKIGTDSRVYFTDSKDNQTHIIDGIENAVCFNNGGMDSSRIMVCTSDDTIYSLSAGEISYEYSNTKRLFVNLNTNGNGDRSFEGKLLTNGEVMTWGSNFSGELGDGTTSRYDDDYYWSVDIPPMTDMFYDPAETVYTIDEENNLWAWGKGYTPTPTLQFNLDEIVYNN